MLAGREAELRQIDELIWQATAGSSGTLVLRGDPGIGKTALLEYAASRAGPMRILRATGIEAETGLAFAGLYSLLHPLADRLAVAVGTHVLPTSAAEDQALLILVDDLHWLDAASQDAFMFALRRLGRDSIACLMTVRSGPAEPPGLPGLEVTGLSREASARLTQRRAAHQVLAGWLAGRDAERAAWHLPAAATGPDAAAAAAPRPRSAAATQTAPGSSPARCPARTTPSCGRECSRSGDVWTC